MERGDGGVPASALFSPILFLKTVRSIEPCCKDLCWLSSYTGTKQRVICAGWVHILGQSKGWGQRGQWMQLWRHQLMYLLMVGDAWIHLVLREWHATILHLFWGWGWVGGVRFASCRLVWYICVLLAKVAGFMYTVLLLWQGEYWGNSRVLGFAFVVYTSPFCVHRLVMDWYSVWCSKKERKTAKDWKI